MTDLPGDGHVLCARIGFSEVLIARFSHLDTFRRYDTFAESNCVSVNLLIYIVRLVLPPVRRLVMIEDFYCWTNATRHSPFFLQPTFGDV